VIFDPGIDVQKMLAVVVSDVEVDGEYRFERRMLLAEDLGHLGRYDRAVQVAHKNGAGFYKTGRSRQSFETDYFSSNFSHLVITARKAFSLDFTSFEL
jgi:hypothetical protein